MKIVKIARRIGSAFPALAVAVAATGCAIRGPARGESRADAGPVYAALVERLGDERIPQGDRLAAFAALSRCGDVRVIPALQAGAADSRPFPLPPELIPPDVSLRESDGSTVGDACRCLLRGWARWKAEFGATVEKHAGPAAGSAVPPTVLAAGVSGMP